jgi:hypothetical protein
MINIKQLLASAAIVTALGSFSMSPAVAQAKSDAAVIETAASGLKSFQVFKVLDANISDGKTLASKLKRADIGIAAIPSSEVKTKTADEIAEAILQTGKSKYSSIVVIVDGPKDVFGVSSKDTVTQDKINSILGEDPVSDASWTLIKNSESLINVQEIIEEERKAADKAAEREAAAPEREKRMAVLLRIAVIAFAGLIIIPPTLYVIRRVNRSFSESRLARKAAREKNEAVELKNAKEASLTPLMRSVNNLRIASSSHKDLGAKSLSPYLDSLILELEEFDTRISEKKSINRGLIEVEYVENLGKLAAIIGPDYYVSMVQEPRYWDNPGNSIARVKRAVLKMQKQVVESIKKLNEDTETNLSVTLKTITREDEIELHDLYNGSGISDQPVGSKREKWVFRNIPKGS